MKINWENFKSFNQEAKGIKYKFEDLCRQLFFNENLSENIKWRYIHSNPNNPGIETEPILDEVNNRMIGFQAKFFDGNVSYKDIEDSMIKTVKYYGEKVDHVYLFCNKPLTTNSLSNAINILAKANITLEPITDGAILDLVRKYEYLGNYYFGNHPVSFEWLKHHSEHMLDGLGERYNQKFNVPTEFSQELSLFVQDNDAVKYINSKKETLLNVIDKTYFTSHDKKYINALERTLLEISDISIDTIKDSLKWQKVLNEATKDSRAYYEKELKAFEEEQNKYSEVAFGRCDDNEKQKEARKKYQELSGQISNIKKLLELTSYVEITEREQQLLFGNVLTVLGRTGTGKSQLLANETKKLLNNQQPCLLLLAGQYLSTEPITKQIMNNLECEYRFGDFLDILEAIGEKDNRIVPVFIDALNETWTRKLWMLGFSEIIDKVKTCPMVKLVVSYRTEYEKILLSEAMIKEKHNNNILEIYHRGFEDNSLGAVKEFLNWYNIPFTPLEYFGYEMSNPLFLTLYCKTYNGDEVSLPDLYERIIENAGKTIYRSLEKELTAKGYSEDDELIKPLINEIVKEMVSQDKKIITKEALFELKYWSNYGITPAVFVSKMVKEHILYDTVYDDEEYYYFAYDQMNDYYCAKAIVDMHNDKDELKEYLKESILNIKDGKLNNSWNIDLFINVAAIFTEKYGEECIGLLDYLDDIEDKVDVFSRYIESFQWRNKQYIPSDEMNILLRRYPCQPESLWKMLIGNSIKVSHPLNADFLHSFLISYEMNRRDFLWTIYINGLTWDPGDRIVQLAQMYNKGNQLYLKSDKQAELLLTLFGWILTSSNRWLRDCISKSMIEILKDNFSLCKIILQKFKNVNDPYVIQRLYGIVFGACCKRTGMDNEIFTDLAEYTYDTIFNKDFVYPDILLRDYARLIIERFLYENPEYAGQINHSRIVPPYKSAMIPTLEDQHYAEKDYEGATFWLMHSMRFEGMGMYGDFGRYVFQSALHSFDVNENEIFNYAVHYILNELGFSEEYFGEHDRRCGSYDRHVTTKIERIGKKYQWITMYNILARISDNCKFNECWYDSETECIQFEGPWNPYIRDFDPTLNDNYMKCSEAATFDVLETFIAEAKEENRKTDICDDKSATAWLEKEGVFFSNLIDTLILNADDGSEWVSLTKYIDTGRNNLAEDKLLVWSWIYGYFAKANTLEALYSAISNGKSIITGNTNSHNETYTVFNREYPWAPSCNGLKKTEWEDVSLPTGKTIKKVVNMPDFILFEKYVGTLDDDTELKEIENIEVPEKEMIVESEITEEVGRILHSTSTLLWEAEYDASHEGTVSHDVPCSELIETLGLEQKEYDGFYYDSKGELAAFDTDLTQKLGGVVVRKDLLDRYLLESGKTLLWIVQGEKEIHGSNLCIEKWSSWEGLYSYDGTKIDKIIRFCGIKN